MKTVFVGLALLSGLLMASCHPEAESGVAIHLLDEPTTSAEVLGADISTLVPEEYPLIGEEHIVSYDQATHEMFLTDEGFQRVRDLFGAPVRTSGTPFCVTVDGEPIYAGAFWTPLSSQSYDGVVILDPMTLSPGRIRIDLGYPGPDFFAGPDPRGDPRIMKSLRKAGKLQ
jgi:hypothetical protein